MKKQLTKERIDRIILSLHQSPNNSVQRGKLWYRLIKMRESLNK